MNYLVRKMQTNKPGLLQYFVSNLYDNNKRMITVKKHKNRNEYFKVEDYWVRNFAKEDVDKRDLNKLYDDAEYKEIVLNEVRNNKLNHPNLASENLAYDSMLIVSDGYNFDEHKDSILEVSDSTCVISVNQALRLWKSAVFPQYYLACNTTQSAMSLLPTKIFPKLIASKRTYHDFVKKYKNVVYYYDPVPDFTYQSPFTKDSLLLVDDYRNPICAAIGVAYHLRVSKIFLAYCSHAFKEHRDGTVKVAENTYQYPQQQLADQLVDASLFWYSIDMPNVEIYHTGIKKSFIYAKYLEKDDFTENLKL